MKATFVETLQRMFEIFERFLVSFSFPLIWSAPSSNILSDKG